MKKMQQLGNITENRKNHPAKYRRRKKGADPNRKETIIQTTKRKLDDPDENEFNKQKYIIRIGL